MVYHNLIVDASVAVKWFSKEEDSAVAEQVLQQCFKHSLKLFAPTLLLYEVGNALWKGKRLDEQRVTDGLNLLLNSPIEFSPLNSFLAAMTVPLMVKHDLTFYDAVYIGLAKLHNAPLVTANPKDHQKVKEVEVIHVNQLS